MKPPPGACQHPLRLPGGERWWLVDARWATVAREAGQAVVHPQDIPPERLLKRGLRRLVFAGGGSALGPDAGARRPWVVKAFPLTTLDSRLKHGKYARSEAHNLWHARQRSVPAPQLFGWGEQRRWSLVRWNAVLMEQVDGPTFTEALVEAAGAPARDRVMERCVGLFRTLYLAGCNHIDLKPEALRLGTAGGRIIDFQYCTFRDQPSLATVMAQAGHFVHWWQRQAHPPEDWIEAWVQRLVEVLEVPSGERAGALKILEDNRRRVPSIAARLRQ